MPQLFFFLSLHISLFCLKLNATEDLLTTAQKSGFVDTGRYAEVQTLCTQFEVRYPQQVRCLQFGTTPQQRPMLALIASADGTLAPDLIRQRNRPVLIAQGGIHAGEIDGKDAGFLLLSELLEGKTLPKALENLTFVFVPVFNVDGHERFGPNNRPNQNGPREMGFRTTAQNYNLNRDYAKADSPEMRAMINLLVDFDPVIYVDLHVTDGADFQHDVSVQVEPIHTGDVTLRKLGLQINSRVMDHLKGTHHKPLDFYPSFIKGDDPSSGAARSAGPPRFSTTYAASRNRFGVLVETHSWKDYKSRVKSTYDALVSLVDQTSTNGSTWLKEVRKADARASQLGGTSFPLTYKNTDHKQTIDFLGYEYKISFSEISGGPMITYFTDKPSVWKIPLFDEVVPALTAITPKAGYVVPVEFASIVTNRLNAHRIKYRVIEEALENVAVTQFKATSVKWAERSFEGRTALTLEGGFEPATYSFAKGSIFIPIRQPLARLAIALLEPTAPDSFASWGDFNNQFERKEYMEGYVVEQVARTMLNDNAKLREEFNKLLQNEDFAKNPRARLDFFYKRHPSFDERQNIYPIYRVDNLPPGLADGTMQ